MAAGNRVKRFSTRIARERSRKGQIDDAETSEEEWYSDKMNNLCDDYCRFGNSV
jgi:hypothetical protein